MAKKPVSSLTQPLVGLVVAQGVLAILFGIAALFWPKATVGIIAVLFGLFVLIWGISLLIQSLINLGKVSLWWLELLFGVALLGVGVFLIRNPEVTLLWLVLIVGFTLVIRGLVDLVQAFFSKEPAVSGNKWLYAFSAAIGLVAGVVVLLYPTASGVAFVWILGLYAIIEGAVLIVLASRFQELIEEV